MILNEAYSSETTAKDGGAIFQAIISHNISWEISNGETIFDQNKINSKLHRVDILPDLNYKEAFATSTYYILSEVNILKRKFQLASEAIKKAISSEYAAEIKDNPEKYQEINSKYFNNSKFSVNFSTDKLALREVSASGIDTGSPSIVLKVSTGMVDQLDGNKVETWNKFNVSVSGGGINLSINNKSANPISKVVEYDDVDNKWDIVFQTILPSVVIEFKGEKANIERYGSRSSEVAFKSKIDVESIFKERENEETLADNQINN